MVKKAKYVSEWNEGIQIKTNCMVDTESKEVFNIEMTSFFSENLVHLNGEYILLDNKKYPVFYMKRNKKEQCFYKQNQEHKQGGNTI